MCLVTLPTPPRFKNPMSKGEPAANQSFTSHILCFPALFYKDLRLAQEGESTYLIWATFDNLFHFTQHTGLILMSHAVSAHLASPLFSHKLPALPRATFFTEEQDKEEKPSWLKLWKVSCPNQSAHSSVRQAFLSFFPHPGRSAPAGESVYHDFSKFNRRNMMSIKGDKNFNTSICSGGASKPRNLTLGVELSSGCQKMCQVSTCFIRCTFFYCS